MYQNNPVIRIDAQALLASLHDYACHRIRTGTNLLETLTSITLRNIDDCDLERFASGAYLLFRDGMDVLEVVQRRLEEGTQVPSWSSAQCTVDAS